MDIQIPDYLDIRRLDVDDLMGTTFRGTPEEQSLIAEVSNFFFKVKKKKVKYISYIDSERPDIEKSCSINGVDYWIVQNEWHDRKRFSLCDNESVSIWLDREYRNQYQPYPIEVYGYYPRNLGNTDKRNRSAETFLVQHLMHRELADQRITEWKERTKEVA